MNRKIKYICNAVKWFDKVNGNTYHSVKITRCKDEKIIVSKFQYGYGESYKNTALKVMLQAKWIPSKYSLNLYRYERENNYPIFWNVKTGLKKECVANGIL